MALRRVPAPDLLKATIKQPLLELPPAGHCYISFRAGIMEKQDGKLSSDKRKGQVAIVRNDAGADAVLWFERVFPGSDPQVFTLAEEADIDQMVFDFEAEFTWIHKERRILKLGFKEETSRNLFFWLQEVSSCLASMLAVDFPDPLATLDGSLPCTYSPVSAARCGNG
jgi:Proteasome complex subunit Rpn13 ubiquitin receptor